MADRYTKEELRRQDARTRNAVKEMVTRKFGDLLLGGGGCLAKIVAIVVTPIFLFNACGNLIKSDSKKSDKSTRTNDYSVVYSDETVNNMETDKFTDALGEAAGETTEDVMKIGEAVWGFCGDTADFIGEQIDINSDYEKAKERTKFALEYLGIIKYDDYEELNELVDLDKINNNTFYIKAGNKKSLIETWIIGEVLKEKINDSIDIYYKRIVFINEDGNEYQFTGIEDFCKLLNVDNIREVKKYIKELTHKINGCVFAEAYSGVPSLSNENDNPRLSQTNNYRFSYNNEDRGQSIVDIIKEQKQVQSYNMNSKVMGSYKARRYTR